MTADFQRPLRLGMVGGGEGAYIGNIHRISARFDGAFQLVAGAFDADAARGHRFAATQGIDPARSYDDFQAMIAAENDRDDRIDVVAICTPNHFPIAKAFLGYYAFDKPHPNDRNMILDRPIGKSGRRICRISSRPPLLRQSRGAAS